MGWVAPVAKLLDGVMDVMSAVTFIQFIEEEAIQSAALGAFLALRHGSYSGAGLAIEQLITLVDHLRAINENIGWMAPYSRGCFSDFADATDTNIRIYLDIMTIKGKQKQ